MTYYEKALLYILIFALLGTLIGVTSRLIVGKRQDGSKRH